MILSGNQIVKEIEEKRIEVSPFNARRVNPGSYDVTLGNKVAVYAETCFYRDTISAFGSIFSNDRRRLQVGDSTHSRIPEDGLSLRPIPVDGWEGFYLDSKKENPVVMWAIPADGWILKPGIGYLMCTNERVTTEHFIPIIDGKSSVGRLFIKIHETAGYGDAGFDGQFTLEVTVQIPIRVYAGMRIGQIRFNRIEGEVTSYKTTGTYRGAAAEGPVASRAYASAFDKEDT